MALYHSPEYQTLSFESTGLSVQEKKFKTDFQNDLFLLFLIEKLPLYFLPSFKSTSLSIQEKLETHFQDGGSGVYLGFPI